MYWIEDASTKAGIAVQQLYWLDNPLHTWQQVKEGMLKRQPMRVCIGTRDALPRFAGYLFCIDGNRYAVKKYRVAIRFLSHVELMGLCLSANLWVESGIEMPPYYEQFCILWKNQPP